MHGRRASEGRTGPYDVIAQGSTPAADPESWWPTIEPYVQAGATWWIEADWETGSVDAIARRIDAGPPRRPDTSVASRPTTD